MDHILVENTPIEITYRDTSVRLEIQPDELARGYTKGLNLWFQPNGRLQISWPREMRFDSMPEGISGEYRATWLRSPSETFLGSVSFTTDNFVTMHDFEVATDYWQRKDSIIRLTREGLARAFREMRKRGFDYSEPSAYDPPVPPKRNPYLRPAALVLAAG